MEEDPYRPPVAELKETRRRRARPKTAIFVAFTFELLLTFLLAVAVLVGYQIYLSSLGYTEWEIDAALVEFDHILYPTIVPVIILMVSVAAGHLCASIAVEPVYRSTLACGLLIALALRLNASSPLLSIGDLAFTAATFLALLFGAWLYVRRQT